MSVLICWGLVCPERYSMSCLHDSLLCVCVCVCVCRDCVQGVGYPVLKKAYDILDHIEEDEVEVTAVTWSCSGTML